MREHIVEMGGASKPTQNKKIYSVAEIQQILGISRPTAYALIKKDLFQSVRMGNDIRIVKSCFDAWLDSTM